MNISNKKRIFFLFIGDLIILLLSLWASLSIRFYEYPSLEVFINHIYPFSILFLIWLLVFYIAGLYEKHTLLLTSRLPSVVFKSQIINSGFAVVFFYLIPTFGISPKTILFIYIFISSTLILFWRIYGIRFLGKGQRSPALLIGFGEEMSELLDEVNKNNRYSIEFISSIDVNEISSIDIQEDLVKKIYSEGIKFVAVDFSNEKVAPLLPHLYNLIFSKVQFIDSHKIYEDVFDRIPLSLVTYSWFLENISISPKFTYDFLKRTMDIALSFILGVISLIFYPIVFVMIKLDDRGDIFISQERIGQNNRIIKIIKFRTMSIVDEGDGEAQRETKITKVGAFLRKTRIDELPQLINVFFGDISLIGPRPELPNLVRSYEKEINFYNVRHLIKPGLSGWAQLYQKNPPKFKTDFKETKTKLSYDLFYIKNRSFLLDIKIAVKTIKTLLSKSGV